MLCQHVNTFEGPIFILKQATVRVSNVTVLLYYLPLAACFFKK